MSVMCLLSLLLLTLAVRAQEPPATAPSQDAPTTQEIAPRVVIAKPGVAIADEALKSAVQAFRKEHAVPAEHKIKITLDPQYDPSKGNRNYITSMVPLNAADQPDGPEVIYRTWFGVSRIIRYKDGVRHGTEQEMGTLPRGERYVRQETPWENGKLTGVRRTYHPNGKLMAETHLRDGLEQGESRSYDDQGQLVRRTSYSDGRRDGEVVDFWPGTDKPKKSVRYAKGVLDGPAREFYASGQLKREIPFVNNNRHGLERVLDTDGKVVEEKYWLNDETATQAEFEKRPPPATQP